MVLFMVTRALFEKKDSEVYRGLRPSGSGILPSLVLDGRVLARQTWFGDPSKIMTSAGGAGGSHS